MKIKWKLSLIFSAIIIATVTTFSILIIQSVHEGIIAQDLEKMNGVVKEKTANIDALHTSASEDLVFALKNPLFVEYFELPETRAGNVYKEGVLQFTDEQRKIKLELEQWIYHFQNKFDVDETCLIDTSGQEHARLVLTKIEADEFLSPEEKSAPFFEPSFKKDVDQVHIQFPYLSPDTHRWVFAYTSPVVLGDGSKPSIYHFEMPIAIFQDLINVEHHGAIYVVDTEGHFIANSEHQYPTTNIPEEFTEFFPSTLSVFPEKAWAEISQAMKEKDHGMITYTDDKNTYHGVFKKLPTFEWYIFYLEDENLIFSEHATVLGSIQDTVIVLALIVMTISLTAVFWISSRITNPILKLRDGIKEIQDGKLDAKINISGHDEIIDLARSFNSMTRTLKKTVELEKELAITQNKAKKQKLETIGELSSRLAHDLRNPLSVLKGTLDLLKKDSKKLDPKTLERFGYMEDSVARMTHQIEHVLKFIRNTPLKIEKIRVYELIDACINSVKIPEGIQIEKNGEDVELFCDAKSIQIVLVNLIMNSIQALEGEGKIKIKISEHVDRVIIDVEDTGSGIPEDVISKIFDPLFTTKQEGTGLGLTSCKNIIEQHGGTISVKNNPTVFSIRIPKRISQEVPEE